MAKVFLCTLCSLPGGECECTGPEGRFEERPASDMDRAPAPTFRKAGDLVAGIVAGLAPRRDVA